MKKLSNKAAKCAAIKDMKKAGVKTSYLFSASIIRRSPELVNRAFSL